MASTYKDGLASSRSSFGADGSAAASSSSRSFSINNSTNDTDSDNHSSSHLLLQPSKEMEQEKRISLVLSGISGLHRFDSLGTLVGRDDETKVISECLARLVTTTTTTPTATTTLSRTIRRRELVMLRGEPGSGKSSLALSIQKHPALLKCGVFVMGKYDMKKGDLPYAAIATAIDDLCRIVMVMGSEAQAQADVDNRPLLLRKKSIVSSLVSDIEESQLSILGTIVPSLTKLLYRSAVQGDDDDQKNKRSSVNNVNIVMNRETLDQSFKTFFRVIASHFPPLVVLLDDLQWADDESLHLLKVLVDDTESDSIMIIGCYRSNEVDDSHILSGVVRDLRDKNDGNDNDDDGFRMTEILLDQFTVKDTNNLIKELLSMDDCAQEQKTLELARLCHRRTSGNVYFLREFLTMLKDEKMLFFDFGICQWRWDLDEIEERTVVTTNIIQLIEGRLKKMRRPDLLEILKIAACLGNRFDRRILQRVWVEYHVSNNSKETEENKTFEALLDAAAEEAILEPQSLWICRFAHDKIQESIIKLMPPDDYKSLQVKVGMFLFQNLSADEMEAMLFVVVDLLNASEQSPSFVSDLNLRAARKAQSLAAFSSASNYVDYGIRKMTPSPLNSVWRPDDYVLALELFSIGAEVALSLGNVQKAVYYSARIIDQKRVRPQDKIRAYQVHAKKLYMGRSPDEALAVCLDILGQLGYSFPRVRVAQQLQANIALDRTRRNYFSKIDSLASRGIICADPRIVETIPLLEQGASTALQAKNKAMYILLRCLCVQLIIDHGLSNEAASCFASFANIMMHEKGDWETGVKLANLALAIQDRLGSRYTETSTMFKTNQLVLGWAMPLKSRLKYIVKGYRSGMLSGNIEGGCWCLMLAIWCQFYDGTPLRCVEEDCEAYIEKMESLRQKNQANVSKWHWQLILNLVGRPENPNTTVISGTAISEEEAVSMVSELNMNTAKLFACAHFGDYATGADIALKIGESHYERLSGMAVFGFERFDRGICLYAHARQSKQSKYKKAAKLVRSRLYE